MVAAPVGPTVETNETSVLVEYRDGTKHQALGPATLVNDAVGRLWRSRVDGFWQVHPSAPAVLVDAVITAAQPRLSDVVWDLYAGVGLFAGALAPLVSDVVAVESEAASCRDGERNLKDLKTVKVVHERVDKWLRLQADPQQLDAPDIVVLDPPRKGAGVSIVGMICGVKPRVVVYVACDPAALARDVALFAAQGYELGELTAYDLFPMTHHVECVAVFTLS
jgi:tRNA/tmRNA/rRNA uracil-C5-methylase (TrmA/RlmC/RlmD family)